MEKKTNYFTIIALVAMLVSFFSSFFTKDLDIILIISLVTSIVAFVCSIGSIVYAKKIEKSKAPGIVLLIISILACFGSGIIFAMKEVVKDPEKTSDLCKQVINCKDEGNNVSTCYIEGDTSKIFDIKCYNSNLNSNQYE